jgi:hypothetical protein
MQSESILVRIYQALIFLADFLKVLGYQKIKIRPVVAKLFYVDRRIGGQQRRG